MFGLKRMAASFLGTCSIIGMLRIEGLPCELSAEFGVSMLVDIDHDHVSRTIVARGPIGTIRNAAFYLRHIITPYSMSPSEADVIRVLRWIR